MTYISLSHDEILFVSLCILLAKVFQQNLHKYFGFSQLHPVQERVLSLLTQQNDVLAVLPTGFGKSLIYQLFALSQPGLTIVITPLLALMFDQVNKLQAKNISAAAWNYLTPPNVKHLILRQVRQQNLKLLYISPEKLQSPLLTKVLQQTNISCVVIDEAHCISEWGADFRPQYRSIGSWIHTYSIARPRPLCCAFTATASQQMVGEISHYLQLHKPQVVAQACFRPNIRWQILTCPSENWKRYLCKHILTAWKLLTKENTGIILIYGATHLDVVWFTLWLRDHDFPQTEYFHAGLTEKDKIRILEMVMHTNSAIVVCTNAFGMGIDLPRVRLVIHLTPPVTLAAYVQEAGRAGRDGKLAYAVTLFQAQDWAKRVKYQVLYPDRENREKRIFEAQAVLKCLTRNECISRQIVRYFRLPETPVCSLRACQCMYCQPKFPWNCLNEKDKKS